MLHRLGKSLVLKAISMGVKVPQSYFERFNELTHLKTLLKALEINCVLDVGANHGQFAHELRAIGYAGYIISFEPVQSEFDLLSNSFRRDSKWMGHQIALGNANRSAEINIYKSTLVSSLLEYKYEAAVRKQAVEVRRLDSLFFSITETIPDPRVFLKMDTQGYDLEIFEGAKGCLEHIKGLQSEIAVEKMYNSMPGYKEALSVYESAGFEPYNLSVAGRNDSKYLLELNALMGRPGATK